MTFDLTGLAVAVIGGVFSVLGIVLTTLINSRMKDDQARTVLAAAVKNALGAIQQASTLAVNDVRPQVHIAGVPDNVAAGVNYVLQHAGDEAARFGITPEALAAKIDAQLGLQALSISPVPLAARLAAPPLPLFDARPLPVKPA